MIDSKSEFIQKFLPEGIKDFDYTQINLDSTDSSIADVLRNLNTLYPKNSRVRLEIESGEKAIGVLCKAESLFPFSGMLLIVMKEGSDIETYSSKYIVCTISEKRITSEEKLRDLIDDITRFLIREYSNDMAQLPDFYRKFVYNESELYEEEDDGEPYASIGY